MWSGVSRFFGNLTGGLIGESDAERRRKEEEERRRQQQASQRPRSTPSSTPNFTPQAQRQSPPPVTFGPQQQTYFGPQKQQPAQPLWMPPQQQQQEEQPQEILKTREDGSPLIRTDDQYEKWKADRRERQKNYMKIMEGAATPYIERFNKADGATQARMRDELEKLAGYTMTYGDEKISREVEDARRRLAVIERFGVDRRSPFNKAGSFIGDMATDMKDWGLNMVEAARNVTGTGSSFEDNERDLQEGRIDKDEFIRRQNELNMRLNKLTGGKEDKGTLDRTLRSFGNAAEGASYFIPGAAAVRAASSPARAAVQQALKTAVAEGVASGASAFREGTNTTATNVAIESAVGAAFGGVFSLGGSFVSNLKKELTADAVSSAEADLGRRLTNEEKNKVKKQVEKEVEDEVTQVKADAEQAERQRLAEEAQAEAIEAQRLEEERVQSEQAQVAGDSTVVPEQAPQPTPEPTQPAPTNPDLDPEGLMARLEERRRRYQENPEEAENLLATDARNREAGYDPSKPVDRENIARAFTELGLTGKQIRELNALGGNGRIYQQILESMNARGFVPDNPYAYIRGALKQVREQNRYNPTNAALNPQKTPEPAINDKGEVITDQNGRPMSKEEYERLTSEQGRTEAGDTTKMADDATPETESPQTTKPVEKAEQIREEQGQLKADGPADENIIIDSEGRRVDTTTGEILDDAPKVEQAKTEPKAPEPQAPKVEATPKTHRTVKDLAKSRPKDGSSYEAEATFLRDVDNYAIKVNDAVEKQLKKDGGSFEGMVAEVDELWQRHAQGERTLTVKDISPQHRAAYKMLRKELDRMYENRKNQKMEGRTDKVEGDQGPFYIPHRKIDEGGAMSTLDDLNGLNQDHSVLSRTTGKMQEMDTSPNLTRKYAIEMLGGSKKKKADAVIEKTKQNAEAGTGRQLEPDEATRYVEAKETFMQDIADAAAKVDGKKLRKFNPVERLRELGEQFGITQRPIEAKMDDAFYKEGYRRLESVQVDGRPVDADLGITQYHAATSDAHGILDGKKKQTTSEAFTEHVTNDLRYMDKTEVMQIRDSLQRELDKIPEDTTPAARKQAEVEALTNALEDAARVNLFNGLQRNVFKDPNLKRLLDIHARKILVAGRAKNDFVTKLTSALANLQDMGLRGWNVKSAMVELSDVSNITSLYGVKDAGRAMARAHSPKGIVDTLEKYGRRNSYAVVRETMDVAKADGTDFGEIFSALSKSKGDGRTALKLLRGGADPRLMIKAAEMWKQTVALNAAEIKFKRQGLKGIDLHRAVRDEARRTSLVNDAESFLKIQENPASALALQYWQWNIRFNAQIARVASGREHLGNVNSKRSQARFAAYHVAQRTALWAALSTSGSSIAYSFGLFDPFGIFEDNWDGIREEDTTSTDDIVKVASVSPITSTLSSAYFAYRQEEERADAFASGDKDKQATYGWRERGQLNKGMSEEEVMADSAQFSKDNVLSGFQSRTPFGNLIPGSTQARKTVNYTGLPDKLASAIEGIENPTAKALLAGVDARGVRQRGYDESRDGRIRYQAPKRGSFSDYYAMVFGKGALEESSEYYDRPKPIRAIKNGDFNQFINEARKDPFFESTLGKLIGSKRQSHRPLTSSFDGGFNKVAMEAFDKAVKDSGGVHTEEARKVLGEWVEIGRKYNRVLDNFQKDQPDEFKKWQQTFEDDIISPEKWAIYGKNPKVWEFARERKKMEAEHLGRSVDPVFLLDAQKAKVVMEERSMTTGDDMLQRVKLYEYDWYEKFKEDEQKYYSQFGSEDADEPNRGERAKKWFDDSKALYEIRKDTKNYPVVAKQYEINDKYGFESPEMEAFWDQYGDAYTEEKVKFDKARLEIVNRMREIEGAEPLTWEQFRAKLDIPEPEDKDSEGYGDKSTGYWMNGKYYKYSGSRGRRSSGRASGSTKKEKTYRTGVADTVPGLGGTPAAIKQVRAEPRQLKDAKKAFRKPRATGQSRIRITI